MISFAGIELLAPDCDGELLTFLRRHLALDDLRLFTERPMACDSPVNAPRENDDYPIGIQPVNYPAPPAPRINSLYWPTGAMRWARGLFLCDEEQLGRILAVIGGVREASYTPQQLVIGDSDFEGTIRENSFSHDIEGRTALSVEMYLLPPRPVSAAEDNRLWILPLVDDRYWWHQRQGKIRPGTWDDVLCDIANAVGVSELEYDDIADEWGVPDPTEAIRSYAHPALLFDAATCSVGRRVIRTVDRRIRLMDFEQSEERHADNLSATREEDGFSEYADIGGGEIDRLPKAQAAESVDVLFRGATEPINRDAAEYEVTDFVTGTVRTFFVPSEDDGSGAADDLADKIAGAYYASTQQHHDRTFAGLKAWNPSGFDNYVEWSFGRLLDDGTYQAETRVASLPPDVGIDSLLNQFESATTTTTTGAPTTTTTPNPNLVAPACDGRCRWTWSAAQQIWTLDSNGCETATTTSTTSTTGAPTTSTTGGPTTTTTPDPNTTTTTTRRPCRTTTSTTTTTGGPTTTTTGGPTTTTTPAPTSCACVYPTFCGTTDAECTSTECSTATYTPRGACDPTTTPDPAGTTTTCDCNAGGTTATPPPRCRDGCDWSWVPNAGGGNGWVLVSSGCSADCPCFAPQTAGSACEGRNTPCVVPPPTTTPAPYCFGNCKWYCDGSHWVLTSNNCHSSGIDCLCFSPGPECSVCASSTYTYCASPPTTTTPAPGGTTTTLFPCFNCFTTTTTTSVPTTTSTTTPAPCSTCKHKWNGSAWEVVTNNCAPCACAEPGYDGQATCETVITGCGTTTTTTAAPTTTTTTCEPCCANQSFFVQTNISSSIGGTCGTCICGVANEACLRKTEDCVWESDEIPVPCSAPICNGAYSLKWRMERSGPCGAAYLLGVGSNPPGLFSGVWEDSEFDCDAGVNTFSPVASSGACYLDAGTLVLVTPGCEGDPTTTTTTAEPTTTTT